MTKRSITCPQCGGPSEWSAENSSRPFCSERCRLIDLGAWANEEYQIATQSSEEANDYSTGDEPGARDATPTMH